MAEAAIAIAYPEPWNRGKALGYWLTYRLSGQILGGAINLGLNADRNEAGKVSYTVFLIFIAIQAAGPFVAFLLNKPHQVERTDGKKVDLSIEQSPVFELKETGRLFFTKKFLLIVLFIGQAVFAEAVFFTYLSCKGNLIFRAMTYADGFSVVLCASSSSWILPGWSDCRHCWQLSWSKSLVQTDTNTALTTDFRLGLIELPSPSRLELVHPSL